MTNPQTSNDERGDIHRPSELSHRVEETVVEQQQGCFDGCACSPVEDERSYSSLACVNRQS